MGFDLEILIPLRNPTGVLENSIRSLTAQTDRRFSVLLSDNHSTTGCEHLEAALAALAAAGIPVRKISPPAELGRVEHWNWLHHQSGAAWLKPLFGGDWLEPDYVAALRAAVMEAPDCAYVHCLYDHHGADGTIPGVALASGGFHRRAEMQERVLRFGMQFGPPSAAAYRRDAFARSGGYDPALPICADSLLFCKLAAREGAFFIARPLAHFLLHTARFSNTLPEKRRAIFREKLCFYAELGLTAWHERWRFPLMGYARLFVRETRQRLREK
jgi:GT2 family glycosyltransferase